MMVRRFFSSLYLIIISLSFLLGPTAIALEKLDYITEEYPPYNYSEKKKDETGKKKKVATGLAVDLLNRTRVALKDDIKRNPISVFPWARGFRLIQVPGKKNVLFSTTRTKERENIFKWFGPISDNPIGIFTRSDFKGEIKTLQDLKKFNFKIGVIRKDVAQDLILNAGVPEKRLKKEAKVDRLIFLLSKNKTKVIAYGKNPALFFMKQFGYNAKDFKLQMEIPAGVLWYAVNKTVSSETLGTLQEALNKVKQDPSFLKSVQDKYGISVK